jgi:hypothetical protein
MQQLRWWPKLLFWFCWLHQPAGAQTNLVINPGFEEISDCPRGTGELYLANHWQNSMFPNAGSVELFHACVDTFTFRQPTWGYPCSLGFGCQYSSNGLGYAGFATIYDNTLRPPLEVLGGTLSTALLKDSFYCFSFFISTAEASTAISDAIDVAFHPSRYLTPFEWAFEQLVSIPFRDSVVSTLGAIKPLQQATTDTVNWLKVNIRFRAKGGERYFSIGNFSRSTQTKATALGWNPGAGYFAHYVFVDDFSMVACPDPVQLPPYVRLYPNPGASRPRLETNLIQENETAVLELLDLSGRLQRKYSLPAYAGEGWELDLYGLQAGMYYLRLWAGNELRYSSKYIKLE